MKKLPIFSERDIHRFWSGVALTANPDKCWNWQRGVRDKRGPYGRFSVKEDSMSAHRVSFYLSNKKDPMDMHVLHRCDNPKCVNPNHLFLGTNEDNYKDKMAKGRQPKGAPFPKGSKFPQCQNWKNKYSKLSESQYYELIDAFKNDLSTSTYKLAEKFGISRTSVSNLLKRMGVDVPKRTKLSESNVLDIRHMAATGVPSKEIEIKYGINNKTIHDIRLRKTWRHI